jgi:hypothetical protein
MPEMDLDVASGYLNHTDVWFRILGYMISPDDEARRRAFVARGFADALGTLERIEQPLDPDPTMALQLVWGSLWQDFYELAGGLDALTTASGAPHAWHADAVRLRDWTTVASILCLVRAIDAHGVEASIGKAMFLITACKGRHGVSRSMTDIRNAWRKYKKISHLAAGVLLCKTLRGFDFGGIVWLGVFLAVARDLQRFGTSFIINAKERVTLLDPSSIWSVPEDLPLPDLDTSIFCRLDERGIEVLKNYRPRRRQ